jgi:mannose-6-phosphate isomerase
MNTQPLKFRPILKERLWGGTKLGDVLGKPLESDITGESWEVSAVPGNVSVVANGTYAQKTLQELINEFGAALLGSQVMERFGTEFPILIKFIDAKQDLSIQLHPNDALAKERHNSFGKTEMWYIMDADPGATLIIGFNKDMDRETYIECLEEDRILDVLNLETVSDGDTFFINTGKIHAIGAGVLLAEIQQTSDITYRVYDFNRKDKEGNFRELHTDLALDAIDFSKKEDYKVLYGKDKDRVNKMVDCPYFKTNFLDLSKDYTANIQDRDSFTILMCVNGEGKITTNDGSVSFKKGETLMVPACARQFIVKTQGMKMLEVTI